MKFTFFLEFRYVVRNETYDVNPLYYSFIQGFVNGSFHMDPPFRKRIEFGATVPLYFSQPRMWGSNTTYSEKVTSKILFIFLSFELTDFFY